MAEHRASRLDIDDSDDDASFASASGSEEGDDDVSFGLGMELLNHLPPEAATKLAGQLQAKDRALEQLLDRNKKLLSHCAQLKADKEQAEQKAATGGGAKAGGPKVDTSLADAFFIEVDRSKDQMVHEARQQAQDLARQVRVAHHEIEKLKRQLEVKRERKKEEPPKPKPKPPPTAEMDGEEAIYRELMAASGANVEKDILERRVAAVRKEAQKELQQLSTAVLQELDSVSSEMSSLELLVDPAKAKEPKGKKKAKADPKAQVGVRLASVEQGLEAAKEQRRAEDAAFAALRKTVLAQRDAVRDVALDQRRALEGFGETCEQCLARIVQKLAPPGLPPMAAHQAAVDESLVELLRWRDETYTSFKTRSDVVTEQAKQAGAELHAFADARPEPAQELLDQVRKCREDLKAAPEKDVDVAKELKASFAMILDARNKAQANVEKRAEKAVKALGALQAPKDVGPPAAGERPPAAAAGGEPAAEGASPSGKSKKKKEKPKSSQGKALNDYLKGLNKNKDVLAEAQQAVAASDEVAVGGRAFSPPPRDLSCEIKAMEDEADLLDRYIEERETAPAASAPKPGKKKKKMLA